MRIPKNCYKVLSTAFLVSFVPVSPKLTYQRQSGVMFNAIASNHLVQKAFFAVQTMISPNETQPGQLWSGGGVEVHQVPLFKDNYCYVIVHTHTKQCMVVDPAEPQKVLAYCTANGYTIMRVLTTHKHWDHAGGNEEMKQLVPECEVFGGATESVPACTHSVGDGDVFMFHDTQVKVMTTPCHTSGHVLYLLNVKGNEETPLLFTGDTLFIGGCGRFFEGNAEQMYGNMKRIGELSKETLVFCGHEYSTSNLKFALAVEPDNKMCQEKMTWCQARRGETPNVPKEQQQSPPLPTVPSTVGDELAYNPFMRCTQESVQKAVGGGSPVEVMHKLREWKNKF
eukprot:GDKI01007765.1.p1 GENE.GDKI01007765.1~~GDKI01007765.1.p1  ORF type:complete len:339 (-),score=100.39 GDKI01007765.1:24-1040(-)